MIEKKCGENLKQEEFMDSLERDVIHNITNYYEHLMKNVAAMINKAGEPRGVDDNFDYGF